jgi:hypothetical protein
MMKSSVERRFGAAAKTVIAFVTMVVWSAVAQAEPPSQVVVYDASGSMYRSDTGEFRYRLAQAVVTRLTEAMRQYNVTTPTGMVVFGRQYFQGLHICHDIEVPVPVPTAGAPNPLNQIVSEAMRTKPNGQTPLLDAMVIAAQQMPPQGGVMTVVTDLDEETCGGDPCDIAARLQAVGKPFGSAVQVGFIVATGLQAGRNGQAVEDFAKCVSGNLRFVDTLERARQVADEIAASLAAWRPPAVTGTGTPPIPAQAIVSEVDVVLTAGFSASTIWPDWTFSEAGAQVTFFNRLQQRDQIALQDNQAKITIPPGKRTFNLLAGGPVWGSAKDVTIQPGQTNQLQILVDPAVITVAAVPATAGQSLAGISFDWTIAGYNRGYVSPSHDAQLRATVPPGAYDVSVTVNGPHLRGNRTFSLSGLALAPGAHLMHEIPIDLHQSGSLTVTTAITEPQLFSPGRASLPELVLTDSNSQERELGRGNGPFTQDLQPGMYRVKLRTAAQDRAVADVEVKDGQDAVVELLAAPSRIVLHAKRGDGTPIISANTLRWTIQPTGAPSVELGNRGPDLDITVPGGDYEISLFGEKDGAADIKLNVAEGQAVAKSLLLRE